GRETRNRSARVPANSAGRLAGVAASRWWKPEVGAFSTARTSMPDQAHEVVPTSPGLPATRGVPVDLDGQKRIRTPWRMGHPLRGSWPGGDGTAGCESSQRERGTTDHLRARQIVRRGQTSAPDPLSATWRLMKRKKGSGLWTAGVSAFQKLIV